MSLLTVRESFDVVIYDNSIQYLLRFEEWEAVSGQGKSARPPQEGLGARRPALAPDSAVGLSAFRLPEGTDAAPAPRRRAPPSVTREAAPNQASPATAATATTSAAQSTAPQEEACCCLKAREMGVCIPNRNPN